MFLVILMLYSKAIGSILAAVVSPVFVLSHLADILYYKYILTIHSKNGTSFHATFIQHHGAQINFYANLERCFYCLNQLYF